MLMSWCNVSHLQNAIANATSLAEVERLKGLLQSGHIPGRELRSGIAFNLHLYINTLTTNDGKVMNSLVKERELCVLLVLAVICKIDAVDDCSS